MTTLLAQSVSNINRLIGLTGEEIDFGSFQLNESSGHITHESYPDFFTGETYTMDYQPDEFFKEADRIKNTIYERIRERTRECNMSLKTTALLSKYGMFVFDASQENIRNIFRGSENVYPIDKGLELIYKAENEADEESLIIGAVNKMYEAVLYAEVHGSTSTEELEFGYFEDFDAIIKGSCRHANDWSLFDIIVNVDCIGKKYNLVIVMNVPADTASIQRAIRYIRKTMKAKEGPGILHELLKDIKDYN